MLLPFYWMYYNLFFKITFIFMMRQSLKRYWTSIKPWAKKVSFPGFFKVPIWDVISFSLKYHKQSHLARSTSSNLCHNIIISTPDSLIDGIVIYLPCHGLSQHRLKSNQILLPLANKRRGEKSLFCFSVASSKEKNPSCGSLNYSGKF